MKDILLIGGPAHGETKPESTRFPILVFRREPFVFDRERYISPIGSPPERVYYVEKMIGIFERKLRVGVLDGLKDEDFTALAFNLLVKDHYIQFFERH